MTTPIRLSPNPASTWQRPSRWLLLALAALSFSYFLLT